MKNVFTLLTILLAAGIGIILFSACTPVAVGSTPPAASAMPLATITSPDPTRTSPPATPSAPPPTSPGLRATPTPQPRMCSPLDGFSLAQLPDLIHNPFSPPRSGSDDPHQGVDFSDLKGPDRIAVAGRPVQAVLAGRVSTVIRDRFPYGNAILIETPVEDLPPEWRAELGLPKQLSIQPNRSALTCPKEPAFAGELDKHSLYLLYAHMSEPAEARPGDTVTCGQTLGTIGSSGNALNPHLHLEVRVGPAGVRFGSMAHYDTSATPGEMAAYCSWRVSGLFQLVDPMHLLSLP